MDSVGRAIATAAGGSEVFVVGGGEICALALPLGDRLLVTEVDLAPEGDAFFPAVDLRRWREVDREQERTEERTRAAFADYERIAAVEAGDLTSSPASGRIRRCLKRGGLLSTRHANGPCPA